MDLGINQLNNSHHFETMSKFLATLDFMRKSFKKINQDDNSGQIYRFKCGSFFKPLRFHYEKNINDHHIQGDLLI